MESTERFGLLMTLCIGVAVSIPIAAIGFFSWLNADAQIVPFLIPPLPAEQVPCDCPGMRL